MNRAAVLLHYPGSLFKVRRIRNLTKGIPMAVTLEANYSKKLGLPGFSSHQYSVTIRTEVADLSQTEAESSRLYRLLQSSVDREIQQTGFLPNGGSLQRLNGQANSNGSEAWNCSAKQKELILAIVEENHLPKSKVEEL